MLQHTITVAQMGGGVSIFHILLKRQPAAKEHMRGFKISPVMVLNQSRDPCWVTLKILEEDKAYQNSHSNVQICSVHANAHIINLRYESGCLAMMVD